MTIPKGQNWPGWKTLFRRIFSVLLSQPSLSSAGVHQLVSSNNLHPSTGLLCAPSTMFMLPQSGLGTNCPSAFTLTGNWTSVCHTVHWAVTAHIPCGSGIGQPAPLTLYLLNFLRGNIKHIFKFYVIPPHWHDTGGWNPSSNKTRTYPFYIVIIMAAGVLATQVARTPAAMILI